MKYLLQHLWKFVKQISKRVTKMIHQPKEGKNIGNPLSSQERHASEQKKLKRKRKSFKSFLKDESQSRKMKRRHTHKTRKSKRAAPLNINQETSDFDMSIEVQDFEMEPCKEHFTNQISPSCSALFQDNNGLQISVIAVDRKPTEEFLNKELDSDEQLFQLICGDQGESDKKNIDRQRESANLSRRKRKNSKQWWQRIVEVAAPSQSRIHQHSNDIDQSFNKSEGSCIVDPGKAINPFHKERKKQSIMKVITIIDLTFDEDCPKIFQVPLALMG